MTLIIDLEVCGNFSVFTVSVDISLLLRNQNSEFNKTSFFFIICFLASLLLITLPDFVILFGAKVKGKKLTWHSKLTSHYAETKRNYMYEAETTTVLS